MIARVRVRVRTNWYLTWRDYPSLVEEKSFYIIIIIIITFLTRIISKHIKLMWN